MQNRNQKPLATRPNGRAEICDLYGAAFLVAAGHRVVAVERVGERRHAFVFRADEQLHADYLRFINNEPVGAQDFVSGVYCLKRLLHEANGRAQR